MDGIDEDGLTMVKMGLGMEDVFCGFRDWKWWGIMTGMIMNDNEQGNQIRDEWTGYLDRSAIETAI